MIRQATSPNTKIPAATWLLGACALAFGPSSVPAAEPNTIVVWAPGYPGDTEQARETMTDFARGVERAAGRPPGSLAAVYDQTLDGGRERLLDASAALALVPAPVLVRYGNELGLRPLLQAIPDSGADDVWSLVAHKGSLTSAAALDGWRIESIAGYAPEFVRGTALGAWGNLPASSEIVFTPRPLGALRRAARGERVAVLADGAQAGALDALPFAGDLEVVARSGKIPASFLCAVGQRLSETDAQRLSDAFLALHATDSGRELLAAMRLARFEPLSHERLRILSGGPAP